jgi:FHA domain-containing protein
VSGQPQGGEEPSIERTGWYLETEADGGTLHRRFINTLPFRIGRSKDLELCLPAVSVSEHHAEIHAAGSTLRLRDLVVHAGMTADQRARLLKRLRRAAPLRWDDRLFYDRVAFALVDEDRYGDDSDG